MITIEPIEKLTTQLSRLPGIGRKTAQRLAYHILSILEAQARELADAITEKQLHVVHEIAGLLGETAVETQSAMQELKQAILPVREDRNG